MDHVDAVSDEELPEAKCPPKVMQCGPVEAGRLDTVGGECRHEVVLVRTQVRGLVVKGRVIREAGLMDEETLHAPWAEALGQPEHANGFSRHGRSLADTPGPGSYRPAP